MVIIIKKYIIAISLLILFKIYEIPLVNNDINLCKYSSIIASNLYENESMVGSVKTEVLDYYIEDNYLYIKPLYNKLTLPIHGIISEANNDYIVIQCSDMEYKISNVKPKLRLYQYYRENELIGYSELIKIEAKSYESLVGLLVINHEQI